MITINRDRNVRRKDYEGFGADTVRVTKIWPTIQGEGPLAGHFAVFVRLAGCNLGAKNSCKFCDTDFNFARGELFTINDVLLTAEKERQGRPKQVVLTGGEPLMQPNVHRLIVAFWEANWHVQVETNGYFWSEDLNRTCHYINDAYSYEYHPFKVVVSPKVNAKQVYPQLNEDLVEAADCLKILIEDIPDSPYYSIPELAKDFRKKTARAVYLSPINPYLFEPGYGEVPSLFGKNGMNLFDLEQCARNHRRAAKLALEHGYRVSSQQHLLFTVE